MISYRPQGCLLLLLYAAKYLRKEKVPPRVSLIRLVALRVFEVKTEVISVISQSN